MKWNPGSMHGKSKGVRKKGMKMEGRIEKPIIVSKREVWTGRG